MNVGLVDGFSLGGYGEVGPRMGGTGFGFGSTISQSYDYNFSTKTSSTTTTAGAYGSIGAFNFGASTSYTYDITHKQGNYSWAVTGGVGVGDRQSGAGVYVGYGSNGVIWGIGGWTHTAADNKAIEARSAKAKAANTQEKKGQATFVTSDEKAKAYIQSMAGKPEEQVLSGLKERGYTYTKTAGNHMYDVVKSGENKGQLSRPYMNSPLTIQAIMSTGPGVPDGSFKGGMNWNTPGSFRGSQGFWQLGINPKTNVIYHFNFVK